MRAMQLGFGKQQTRLLIAAILITLFLLVTLWIKAPNPLAHYSVCFRQGSPTTTDSNVLARLIRDLYQPVLHPITAPSFTDEVGRTYHVAREPVYTSTFGKRLLILDIDSRPMNEDGQVMSLNDIKWPGLQPMAAGFMSHYLYAMIHGYDYKFIKAPVYSDRHVTWSKVPMLTKALKSYEIVVFLDQDAMFHYPALPIEWLMNYWNHTLETRLMLAEDPDRDKNKDDSGTLYHNTGFIVARNSPRTFEIMDAWEECPRETKYFGCSRLAYQWPHEQAALGAFVSKLDFNEAEDIRGIPCSEANGSPMTYATEGCNGTFVRHFWMDGKSHPPAELADNILRYAVPMLHRAYLSDVEHFLEDFSNFSLPGNSSFTISS